MTLPGIEKYRRAINLRIPGTVNTYPVLFELNAAHWGDAPWTADGLRSDGAPRYKGVQHDEAPRPHEWQWWRLFALNPCVLHRKHGHDWLGWRLWVYTRWGSLHADFHVDRR